MAERPGLAGFVDNDANLAALAEHRAGAARGASDAVVLTLGTGIGGGLILDGELYRGARGGAGELGHMVIDSTARRARATAPAGAAWRRSPRARRSAREASATRRQRPNRASAGRWRRAASSTGRWSPSWRTTATRRRSRRSRLIGARLGVAITSLVNIFNPEVVVIGGGVIAAGELLLAPARAEVDRARAAAVAGPVRIVAARFGVEAGMVGRRRAGLRRRRIVTASASAAMSAAALIVCPTPIGNLEDVTLRVLAALREADLVACEDTRRTRVLLDRYGVAGKLVSYHEHNERARAGELVERMRAGAVGRARLRRRHAAGLRPGLRARAGVRGRRARRSRCCPGRSAALAALVAQRLPSDHWRFVGFLPRKRGELEAVLRREPGDARRVRVAAPDRPRRWPCWPSSTPSGRSPSAGS